MKVFGASAAQTVPRLPASESVTCTHLSTSVRAGAEKSNGANAFRKPESPLSWVAVARIQARRGSAFGSAAL